MPVCSARAEVIAGLIEGLSWAAERTLPAREGRRYRGVVLSRHKKAPDDAGALELLN